jgi:glycosyltransferase involved in cell wall biosynthesis
MHLIDAWRVLRSRGLQAQLDIYGEGPLRSDLMNKIEADGLSGCVRLRGFTHDVLSEFRNSLFHVLVSEIEGFPNTVVEAAAQHVASLVSDVPGSRDTVPPDVILPNKAPYGNSAAIADALAKWFTSPEKVQSDGIAFHRFITARVSPAVISARYQSIYDQVACGAPRRQTIGQLRPE